LRQLTQAINKNMYGSSEAVMGTEDRVDSCAGFGLAVYPCKGILQARFKAAL